MKARSWQLLILLYLPFLVAEFVTPLGYRNYPYIIGFLLFFGWLLTVHQRLTALISQKIEPTNILFIINIFFLTIVFCGVNIFFEPGSEIYLEGALAFIGLYFFFALFQVFYSTAKRLVMAEKQKNIALSDFIGEFFLFVIFPIGIWFLQPRIKKTIIKSEEYRSL